jgi:hypothetical protein
MEAVVVEEAEEVAVEEVAVEEVAGEEGEAVEEVALNVLLVQVMMQVLGLVVAIAILLFAKETTPDRVYFHGLVLEKKFLVDQIVATQLILVIDVKKLVVAKNMVIT